MARRSWTENAESPQGAVILGGAHGSLAVARSLGRRGIPVWFIADNHPIASYSRYIVRSLTWPGPDREGAIDRLLDLAVRNGLRGWVLFAGGDAEVQLVSRAHAELSTVFRLPTPPWEITRSALDKRLIHEHAASVGLHSPWSLYPEEPGQLGAAAGRFPVILKPTIRVGCNAFTAAKAWRADNAAELLCAYRRAVALVGHKAIALQEWIPGDGAAQFSYAAVWDRGAPCASLVARRTRQYPIDFGFTSTFVETIEQSAVEEAACRFLSPLRYSSMVEAKFKYDARDGRYKLLDVNPRIWTWIALGAAAGVDFPLIQWRLAMGQEVIPARAEAGRAWMHASRDMVAAIQLLAGRRLAPSKYFGSWLRPLTFAAAAADDPLPGIRYSGRADPCSQAASIGLLWATCCGHAADRDRRFGVALIDAVLA